MRNDLDVRRSRLGRMNIGRYGMKYVTSQPDMAPSSPVSHGCISIALVNLEGRVVCNRNGVDQILR
jgi:hypothetical protein